MALVLLSVCGIGYWILFPISLCCLHLLRLDLVSLCPRRNSWPLMLVLLLGMTRVGEASNPGPTVHFDVDIFTLGTFNPSGLRNKEHYIQAHLSTGDVWTMAETHFFGKDVSRFKAGLRAVQSPFRYCVTDQTSLARSLVSPNSWKGVGVISKHPTRAVPSSLPQHVQDSGRALLFTTLLGDAWISGGVMYGEPNAHLYPAYMKNNEMILHHLVTHVCNLSSGPRFVSGDWNVQQDSLPAFGLLAQAGFREIQDVALERWGQMIQPTCKGRTRPDFLYVSPELADLLVAVEVMHDVWPDHSVLLGRFRSLVNAPSLWVWPQPMQFVWPQSFPVDLVWPPPGDCMTEQYAYVWNTIETAAADVSVAPVTAAMCGRGKRLQPKPARQTLSAPIKVGRKGDFQPGFFGSSLKHAQWIRQVRRLQAYARLATNLTGRVAIQKAESWRAVVHAVGFSPSFQDWWNACDFKTAHAPLQCPVYPPDANTAMAMFESVGLAVRALETELRRSSRQYAKFRRDQNPNLFFSDIRPQGVPGVDVLLKPVQAKVEAIDADTGQVVLDQPCEFVADHVISCNGVPLKVIHHDSDAVWLEDTNDVSIGSMISQTRFIGTHAELEEEFVRAWRSRWMRHENVPADRWSAIIAFSKRYLPRFDMHWGSMTPTNLSKILAGKKTSTSHGLDGVTLQDLKSMPETVLQVFCDMFCQSERTGAWPLQLTEGKVVSLAKIAMPGSPADFRPITVFSLLYRAWSSFHSRQALQQIDEHLPDTLYGCRPGRYAAQVWAKLLWSVEHSFQNHIDMSGLVADLQKAFNMIPRLVVFEIAGHIGFPGHVLVGWAGALSQMNRRFLLRGSLTSGIPSVTGFPEGCGLSCVAMLIIDFAFHSWQQAFFPLCTALTYVDDWQVLCSHSSMIEGAKLCLDRFVQAVDLQLDPKKTYTWSITSEGRQRLKTQGFAVVLSAKNLGAHVQMSRKHTNASLMDRVNSMAPIWPRLRLSACRYKTKVRALLVAAWPRALHAI